jgi:hypothetical protein
MAAVLTAEENLDDDALDRRMDELQPQLEVLGSDIWAAPVRSLADLRLLAETLHWELWTEPRGMTDASLARRPAHCMDERAEQALAALLRAIRDLKLSCHRREMIS